MKRKASKPTKAQRIIRGRMTQLREAFGYETSDIIKQGHSLGRVLFDQKHGRSES
jgi:hypothetical protein